MIVAATRGSKQLERDVKVRLLRLERDKSRGRGRILQRGRARQNTPAEKQGDSQTQLSACYDPYEWEKHAIKCDAAQDAVNNFLKTASKLTSIEENSELSSGKRNIW